jgi:hypothetical protein
MGTKKKRRRRRRGRRRRRTWNHCHQGTGSKGPVLHATEVRIHGWPEEHRYDARYHQR